MRPSLTLALALSLLSVDLLAQRPDGERGRGRGRSTELREIELSRFDVLRTRIEAPSMADGSIPCLVYVPKAAAVEGQDAETTERDADVATQTPPSYPWAVWLHGLNDGFHRFHNDGGAETLEAMREAGEIPDTILVVPTVARQTLYVDGESNGDVEKALTDDLVAWVEATFPVKKDRAHRAVMGVSMGGYGALKIAMRHPDVFAVVAAHSSAILPADPEELPEQYDRTRGRMGRMLGLDRVFGDPIDPEKWAANMPLGLVRDRDAADFADLRIYFDAGTDDRYGFGPTNEALHRAMDEKEIAHTFRLVEGGGHSWGSDSMRENLRHSFRFVAEAFAAADEAAAKAEPAGAK